VVGASTAAAVLSVDASRDAERLLSEAIRYEDAGLFERAIEKHEAILQVRPREVRSLNAVASLKGALDLFSEQLAWADRAIEIDSKFAPAWANRGSALGALDRLEEADVAFGQALQLDQTLVEAHHGRGAIADTRQDFDTAIYHYREAVSVDPSFEDGWFNLAATLTRMQRYDEAMAAVRQVLELNPNAQDALTMLQDLTRRTAEPTAPRQR
jgi:protein O-GlcNAc transferase